MSATQDAEQFFSFQLKVRAGLDFPPEGLSGPSQGPALPPLLNYFLNCTKG